jgi:hypothetical protein
MLFLFQTANNNSQRWIRKVARVVLYLEGYIFLQILAEGALRLYPLHTSCILVLEYATRSPAAIASSKYIAE